jgi:hypothetical protein
MACRPSGFSWLLLLSLACSVEKGPTGVGKPPGTGQDTSTTRDTSFTANGHEPDGFFLLTDFTMDRVYGDLGGWVHVTAGPGSLIVVRDESTPGSRSNVGEFRNQHSEVSGDRGQSLFQRAMGRPKEVYLAFWLELGMGWQGSTQLAVLNYIYGSWERSPFTSVGVELKGANTSDPQLFLSVGDSATDNSHLVNTSLETTSFNGGVRYLGGNVDGNYTIVPGRWYRVAIYVKQSMTATSRDGIVRWWVNQHQVGNYTTVNFLPTAWDVITFGPPIVWTVPADTVRVDDIRISVPAPSGPGAVTDLRVGRIGVAASPSQFVGRDSVVVGFSGADDGTGMSAKFDLRYREGAMDWGAARSLPIEQACLNSLPRCIYEATVTGLSPNTTYSFQLVAYRGVLNHGPVFGPMSNVVTVTTKP